MSTPPPTPPPGNSPPGNYYVQSPPNRGNSSGCWKATGLTCGVLFLLALIGVIIGGRALRENMAHPQRGSIMGTGVLVFRATQDGQTLQRAIVGYDKAHGKYPGSLLDLVREGRVDGKILHNDLDPNPSPGSISWRYIKPAPGADSSTPLLTETYAVNVPAAKPQQGTGTIVVTLGGGVSSAASGSAR